MEKNYSRETIHQINNLLASLSLAAEIILADLPSAPTSNKEQKKQLKNILSDAKKIQKLVKKL